MRLKEFVKEAVEPGGQYLYHVTNDRFLPSIIKAGEINTGYDYPVDDGPISFTRDPNYRVSPGHKIQIVLSRAAIEASHELEPYQCSWTEPDGAIAGTGDSESEERAWCSIPFNNKYVVQINSQAKLPETVVRALQQLNIPLEYK